MKKNLIYSAAALVLVIGLGGCEDDNSVVKDFIVDRESLTLPSGDKARITISPSNGASFDTRNYIWESEDPTIATVSSFGVVTAVADPENNVTTNVKVRYGNFSKTIPVTVLPLPVPARKGSWLFDDADDLFKADIGTNLVPGTGSPAIFGATEGFAAAAGPSANNGAIHVDRGYFLQATHGMAPSGTKADGTAAERVNEYTIFLELKCTSDKDANYKALLHMKSESHLGDSDWFMRKDYIGGGSLPGSPEGSVRPEEWNRLLISIKNGEFYRVYLNGNLISENTQGNRGIDNDRISLLKTCLFFADEDGEDAAWDVSEIAMWNIAFNSVLVTKLERELSQR